jgi:hypothetical protein
MELRHGSDVDYWRFTVLSCQKLFGDVFGAEHIEVRSYGNVLSVVAWYMGMSADELSRRELDVWDWGHPLVVAVRAVKQA